MPQCDTLHALVRDYRLPRNVLLNVEHRLMLHFAPDLDSLTLLEKVEVFKHALAHTSGMDLCRVLWMNAPTSEAWLERHKLRKSACEKSHEPRARVESSSSLLASRSPPPRSRRC